MCLPMLYRALLFQRLPVTPPFTMFYRLCSAGSAHASTFYTFEASSSSVNGSQGIDPRHRGHTGGKSQHTSSIAHKTRTLEVHNVEFSVSQVRISDHTRQRLKTGYDRDSAFQRVWKNPEPGSPFKVIEGLLYLCNQGAVARLCVPSGDKLRTDILAEFHDGANAAHPGIQRTTLKIAQWYYWPTLEQNVREYVLTCQTCAQWKSSSVKKIGKLMPIPVPEECWQVVTMDFIVGLPESDGFDAIMTVVDKLSKRAKYAATFTTAEAPEIARLFFDTVVHHHGLPKVIISDRDPKFTSKFWKSLMAILGVKFSMTTAHRAQADGQTERQNLVLEDALRCMVSCHGEDWNKHLGTIEYAHSTLVSSSSKLTPFEIDTGRMVRNPSQHEELPDQDILIAEFAKK